MSAPIPDGNNLQHIGKISADCMDSVGEEISQKRSVSDATLEEFRRPEKLAKVGHSTEIAVESCGLRAVAEKKNDVATRGEPLRCVASEVLVPPLRSNGMEGPLALTGRATGWEQLLCDLPRRSFAAIRRGAFREDTLRDWYLLCDQRIGWNRPNDGTVSLPRDAAWLVGPRCSCHYEYGPKAWPPTVMPEWFMELTRTVCDACGVTSPPNACNANRYVTGDDSVGWHSDDEPLFQAVHQDALVISLSLGSPRTFMLSPIGQRQEIYKASLGNGDLCTMEGLCQKHYLHRVPKDTLVSGPRINLTWRWIVQHGKDCGLGAPEGELRQKLLALAEAREKLQRLQDGRRKVVSSGRKEACGSAQGSPGGKSVTVALGAKLAQLAEARTRLSELQRQREQSGKPGSSPAETAPARPSASVSVEKK